MNRKEKLITFMHFHNPCTCDGDHLILLINTGNAHKGRVLPQTIVDTFKKCKGARTEA